MSYRAPGKRDDEGPGLIHSYADALRARDRRFGGPWGHLALICAGMVLVGALQIAFGLSVHGVLALAVMAVHAGERWLRATGRRRLFVGDDPP